MTQNRKCQVLLDSSFFFFGLFFTKGHTLVSSSTDSEDQVYGAGERGKQAAMSSFYFSFST